MQSQSHTESSAFAPTRWTLVLEAGDEKSARSAEALEALCRTYWYPLYSYVRRKGYSPHDAEDLTQGFFAHLLRGDFPAGVQPEGGRFRSYLLKALQYFLINEWHKARARKRGAGRAPLSLQELDPEGRYRIEPADETTPEELFDRRWAAVLLERVRKRLQEEYAAGGKRTLFARLEPCLTGAEPMLPYTELARQLGSSEGAVKMAVHRLRKRYGELLRSEIRETVARPEDVEEEIRSLLAAV